MASFLAALVMASTSGSHIDSEASNCWVISQSEWLVSFQSAADQWSAAFGMRVQRMTGGAIALYSKERGLLVTIHPFPDDELVQVTTFSRDAGADSVPEFSKIAEDLEHNSSLASQIKTCTEVGRAIGTAQFERP